MERKILLQAECESLKDLKGLAQAKIIKKSVILFRVLNMTIYDVSMYID